MWVRSLHWPRMTAVPGLAWPGVHEQIRDAFIFFYFVCQPSFSFHPLFLLLSSPFIPNTRSLFFFVFLSSLSSLSFPYIFFQNHIRRDSLPATVPVRPDTFFSHPSLDVGHITWQRKLSKTATPTRRDPPFFVPR